MSEHPIVSAKPAALPSTHVRFTPEEYLRLQKDQLLTGKSIPWLLKAAYFGRADFTATLDVEIRKAVRREIAYIGNNLNQAEKALNSGLKDDFQQKFDEVVQGIRCLRSFLGLTTPDGTRSLDGNRKDSL